MINISKEEIGDKMFFVRDEDSNQPIAVIKVADLLEKEVRRMTNKGDLISREAFKKALDEQMNFEENCRDSVFDIIDNASTVEPETKLVERPQGEWKFKKFDEETGISNSDWCPFCGKAKAQVYDKFCGNCGADLRGKK